MDNFHLISKYAICYGIFFLISFISKIEHGNRLFDSRGPVLNPGILVGFQIAGILWLGVVPFFIFHYSLSDIVFGQETPTILQLCCLVLLLLSSVIIATITTARINALKGVQQQQIFSFKKDFLRKYIPLRIIFLIIYELFFRGHLLTTATDKTGTFTSVAINTSLYALLHLFNDRKELIACIPFGIILCSICLWFGAAWPAIVIHTVFAITYELNLLKKNPHTINKTQHENIRYRFVRLYRK